VEEGPAAITALCQVVARHEVLGREHRRLLAVPELEAGLNDLGEGHGVARSTGSLVAERICEIEAIQVPEIVRLRNQCIWDLVGSLVLLCPALGLFQCILEVFAACLAEVLRLVVSSLV